MRLLADESVDGQIVAALRSVGHEVDYIAEAQPGIDDDSVLKRSNELNSLLLTADKDFGELVFRMRRQHVGVILIRLAGLPPEDKSAAVVAAISAHEPELAGAFTVISKASVRLRRLLDA